MRNNLPSHVGVDLLSLVHDFVEGLDKVPEVLDLLRHVLVALQCLVVLPGCRISSRDRQTDRRLGEVRTNQYGRANSRKSG